MANSGSTTRHVRIAAAVLAVVIVAFAVLTYLSYTAAFTSTDSVTVTSPRAGLVMEKDAKVKYRGVQVGKVENIAYSGDQAKLTLAIDSNQMRYIPSNADVRIASNTIFGAKSVEFVQPTKPSGKSLRPGATVAASAVQLEVNTLFQTLVDLLHKINPIDLNATLSAIAEGLRGHGDDFGASLAGLNEFLPKINPKMPSLQSDFQQAAAVGNIYGDAAPDLVTVLDNVPTISNTLVDEQDNLNATLLAATGLADNGTATLEPAQEDLIAAHSAVPCTPEGAVGLLAGVRLHLPGHQEGHRPVRARHRRHQAGSFRVVQLRAGRSDIHLSGEPADRERFGRPELPWPTEHAQQAVRRILVPLAVPGHRQRVHPLRAVHRSAGRCPVDAAVPVQRCLRRTG